MTVLLSSVLCRAEICVSSPERSQPLPLTKIDFTIEDFKPAPETKARAKTEVRSNPCQHGAPPALRVCRGLNFMRREAGLPLLVSDPKLTAVAQAYAEHLYRTGQLTHGDFKERIRAAGLHGSLAENIAQTNVSPDRALILWRNSPPHNENMMNRTYSRVGTGYFRGYWVQLFSAQSF